MNDEQSPPPPTTTPPPPPPPPPVAPQPPYPPASHEQTGPIAEFAQAPTRPSYHPAGPSQGYQETDPTQGYQQATPVQGYQPTAHATGYTSGPPAPPAGTAGMPAWQAAPAPRSGPSFLRSLFDFSFHSFITRRLAPAIYAIGLVAIGIGALIALFSGLAGAFTAMSSSFTAGVGALMLIGSLIGVPLVTLVFVIVLRLSVEAGIALVAVAENTERTASNTEATEAH